MVRMMRIGGAYRQAIVNETSMLRCNPEFMIIIFGNMGVPYVDVL